MEDLPKIESFPDRSYRPQTLWLAVVTVAAMSMTAGAWWAFRRQVDTGAGWGALGVELGLTAGTIVTAVLLFITWSVARRKIGLRSTLAVAALLVSMWMLVSALSKYGEPPSPRAMEKQSQISG